MIEKKKKKPLLRKPLEGLIVEYSNIPFLILQNKQTVRHKHFQHAKLMNHYGNLLSSQISGLKIIPFNVVFMSSHMKDDLK